MVLKYVAGLSTLSAHSNIIKRFDITEDMKILELSAMLSNNLRLNRINTNVIILKLQLTTI